MDAVPGNGCGTEAGGGVKRRPWRCLLCPTKGIEADLKATTAAFYRHYMAKHMDRSGE